MFFIFFTFSWKIFFPIAQKNGFHGKIKNEIASPQIAHPLFLFYFFQFLINLVVFSIIFPTFFLSNSPLNPICFTVVMEGFDWDYACSLSTIKDTWISMFISLNQATIFEYFPLLFFFLFVFSHIFKLFTGELYVQAQKMFDSGMYAQLLSVIHSAINEAKSANNNFEAEFVSHLFQSLWGHHFPFPAWFIVFKSSVPLHHFIHFKTM